MKLLVLLAALSLTACAVPPGRPNGWEGPPPQFYVPPVQYNPALYVPRVQPAQVNCISRAFAGQVYTTCR